MKKKIIRGRNCTMQKHQATFWSNRFPYIKVQNCINIYPSSWLIFTLWMHTPSRISVKLIRIVCPTLVTSTRMGINATLSAHIRRYEMKWLIDSYLAEDGLMVACGITLWYPITLNFYINVEKLLVRSGFQSFLGSRVYWCKLLIVRYKWILFLPKITTNTRKVKGVTNANNKYAWFIMVGHNEDST